ncbi:putative reverse transcriptase domain-containing protein [Tanacetum coccineum]|uniref:Reverse transcriptase domain-containing protein n=1 Tax=Tanacetum coccineum TaxID=301880 RepID=A0ABQ4YS08_9ASTR
MDIAGKSRCGDCIGARSLGVVSLVSKAYGYVGRYSCGNVLIVGVSEWLHGRQCVIILVYDGIPTDLVDDVPVEDEFMEEEDPQEEDMIIGIFIHCWKIPEVDGVREEVDPLNPPPPASESEPDDEIEIENPIEHEDETVPVSVYETAHALVEKKGEAKDRFYGKLILDLGNEVCSSVEQGTAAMEKLVEKLENVEEKAECEKLKKELEEARLSITFLQRPMKAIKVPIEDEKSPLSEPQGSPQIIDVAIAAERERQAKVRNDASGSGPVRGQDTAPAVRECTFAGFMKCNPTVFCRIEGVVELQRWFEKTESVKEYDIVAYTQRFNELALMCPRMVEPERVKCTIKCYKCGKVGHKSRYCKEKSVGTGANAQPVWTCYDCGEQGHTRNRCPKKVKQEEVGEVRGRSYAIKDAEPKGPNVVTEDSYEIELADGRIVSMNIVLKGCTLSLVNHVFEIDFMPIELGTFDVIIGMDWLVKHDAVIVYGEKVVRTPYGNKTLIIEGDKGVSRLKVISCIKARKYIERGCHLFLAHFTEKNLKEKRMKDVPVICDFPKVLLEVFPGLPPPRQVEFRIDLVPEAAPVARAPYRLAPSEMKELSKRDCTPSFRSAILARSGTNFLGHVIDRSGVHVDSAKIEAIKSWDAPTTPTEIELLSDYDCGIRYHLGKADVVADALSRKERDKPLRVRALMMAVHNDLPKQIRENQEEAIKGKNVKAENLGKLIKQIFEFCPNKTRCFGNHFGKPKPSGDSNNLKICLEWKGLTMDFLSGIPRNNKWKRWGEQIGSEYAYHPQTIDKVKGLYKLYFERDSYTFHVLNLKKCLAEGDIIILMEEIQLDDKLHMIEEPAEIVDREVKRLKQSRIPIVKVRWKSQRGPEFYMGT